MDRSLSALVDRCHSVLLRGGRNNGKRKDSNGSPGHGYMQWLSICLETPSLPIHAHWYKIASAFIVSIILILVCLLSDSTTTWSRVVSQGQGIAGPMPSCLLQRLVAVQQCQCQWQCRIVSCRRRREALIRICGSVASGFDMIRYFAPKKLRSANNPLV